MAWRRRDEEKERVKDRGLEERWSGSWRKGGGQQEGGRQGCSWEIEIGGKG